MLYRLSICAQNNDASIDRVLQQNEKNNICKTYIVNIFVFDFCMYFPDPLDTDMSDPMTCKYIRKKVLVKLKGRRGALIKNLTYFLLI